jgi:hypothetical protein
MDDIVVMLRQPTGCVPPTEWELRAAKEIEKLRKALRPFAACVFNDNGDVTYDFSHAKPEDYWKAYRSLPRI